MKQNQLHLKGSPPNHLTVKSLLGCQQKKLIIADDSNVREKDEFWPFFNIHVFVDLHFSYFYLYTFNNDSLIKEQCSRISISCYPWQVNYGHGKVDFQTFDFVVRGQVNFKYWIEEYISNDFKTVSFAQLYKWRIILLLQPVRMVANNSY
jgi:hypothetical protein